jgi:hypothetical protein
MYVCERELKCIYMACARVCSCMCFSSHILAFALHCKGVLGIVLVCSECVCMHMRDGSGSGSGG